MLTALERAHLEARLLKEQLGFTATKASDEELLATEQLLCTYLLDTQTISSARWKQQLPDEPHFFQYSVRIKADHGSAGGTSLSRARAMRTALAEAVERSIWLSETRHLRYGPPTPSRDMPANTPRASAYVLSDKTHTAHLATIDDIPLRWSKAYSYTARQYVSVPSQMLSATYAKESGEIMLRQPITTGLATAPTRNASLLSGALEVIERDAFMVTWLSGMSPANIIHDSLTDACPELGTLLASCTRYRLKVDFVRLFTDAPTYAIMAVVSDPSNMPPVAVGAAAGPDAGRAALKGLLEALRARQNSRAQAKKETSQQNSRLGFWAKPEHTTHAAFLTANSPTPLQRAPWHNDTVRAHFARIIDWARALSFDLLAADLSAGEANVPGWHIHQVIIPQLQPLYQDERQKSSYGSRVPTVLKLYGHTIHTLNTVRHPFV